MSFRKLLVLAILAICLTSCQSHQKLEITKISSLAENLSIKFDKISDFIENNHFDSLETLIDPIELISLKFKAEVNRTRDINHYIKRNYSSLPHTDTLQFYEIKNTENFIRVTYIGDGNKYQNKTERVLYTFLLFRNCESVWKLAATSSIEKERFDSYGNEMTFHETELPALFRFPRII